MAFDYNKSDTRNKRMGALGVRSVIRTLYFEHKPELDGSGCTGYHVYEVTNKDEQMKGVDIVEEWVDAQQHPHKKAHEVKTEERIASDATRGVQQEITDYIGDGKEYKGTGNVFVEMVQNTRTGDTGWYPKMKSSRADIEKRYSDGRNMWIVAYIPRPKRGEEKLMLYTTYAEDGSHKNINFTIGSFLLWEIPFKNYSSIVDDYLEKYGKNKIISGGNNSKGVPISIKNFFSGYEVRPDGGAVYGKKSKEGSYIHFDTRVWEFEKKDIDEPWTGDDYAPLELWG